RWLRRLYSSSLAAEGTAFSLHRATAFVAVMTLVVDVVALVGVLVLDAALFGTGNVVIAGGRGLGIVDPLLAILDLADLLVAQVTALNAVLGPLLLIDVVLYVSLQALVGSGIDVAHGAVGPVAVDILADLGLCRRQLGLLFGAH